MKFEPHPELLKLSKEGRQYGRQDWMNDTHWALVTFLAIFYKGAHHFPFREANIKEATDHGISVCVYTNFATYDFGNLTRLVLMAHEYWVRVELVAAAPGYIRMTLHQREQMTGDRDQDAWKRHPSIRRTLYEYERVGRDPEGNRFGAGVWAG